MCWHVFVILCVKCISLWRSECIFLSTLTFSALRHCFSNFVLLLRPFPTTPFPIFSWHFSFNDHFPFFFPIQRLSCPDFVFSLYQVSQAKWFLFLFNRWRQLHSTWVARPFYGTPPRFMLKRITYNKMLFIWHHKSAKYTECLQ